MTDRIATADLIDDDSLFPGSPRLEALKAAVRRLGLDTIVDVVRTIGGSTADRRLVRAAAIDVYIERKGLAAGDALMDEIGL